MPVIATTRRTLGPVLGRVARFSPGQWAGVAMVLAALVAGAIAAAVLLTPAAPATGSAQAGPPLINPAVRTTATPSGVRTIPATVRLIVPSAGIDIAVIQGDGVHVPLSRAMHYPGSGDPGGGSTSLFYAHARRGMFLGLWKVRAGDAIRAVRADGSVIAYTVREVRNVPASDLDILRPTPYDQIILLTCTTYSPYDPRYIVIGTPS